METSVVINSIRLGWHCRHLGIQCLAKIFRSSSNFLSILAL